MPSLVHASLVELFRESPSLAVTLCRESLGRYLPDDVTAQDAAAEISEIQPAEYRADDVLRIVDREGKLVAAFVVEIQLRRDPDKRYSWPLYLAGVQARLRCPVALIVLTLDEDVAEWCRQPIDQGFGRTFAPPLVFGPGQIPVITDPAAARECPELAVLSVAAHASGAHSLELAETAMAATEPLDSHLNALYSDFVFAFLSDAAPQTLEHLMDLRNYEFKSEFARKYAAIGREEGRKEALRDVLGRQLEHRFGELPSRTQERIAEATEAELRLWSDRVIDAESIAAVFASDS